jgi:uncharacterized protein YbaR (Trm112 family)
MKPDLLEILCCPETRQPLKLADAGVIGRLNGLISKGGLKNRAGKPVTAEFSEALVRADGKYLYPVRNNIPVMLIDEAIPL